jgi:WD40 repeat protein
MKNWKIIKTLESGRKSTWRKKELLVTGVSWSPDGNILITGCQDSYVNMYYGDFLGSDNPFTRADYIGPTYMGFDVDAMFFSSLNEFVIAGGRIYSLSKKTNSKVLKNADAEHPEYQNAIGACTKLGPGHNRFVQSNDHLKSLNL